ANIGTIVRRRFVRLFPSEVFSDGNELHLRSDDAAACIRKLRYRRAICRLADGSFQSGKGFQADAPLALSRVFEAQVAVVLGPDRASLVLRRIAAIDNPLLAEGPHSLTRVADLVRISPRSARVVNPRAHAV